MEIIAMSYLSESNTTTVTVQTKERKSAGVVKMSDTYEVTLEGSFQLGTEEIEDAAALKLEAAGVVLSQVLG